MPPKRKVDPEQLLREYEKYQISDEYKLWKDIKEMKSKLLEITKTNDYPDLYNSSEFELKFQAFHDAIFNFATTKFKTKTRLKEIKHEWIRSAFFAKENFTEKEKEKDIYWVDGIKGGVTKQSSDKAQNVTFYYKNIWRNLDEIDNLNENTFQAERKKFIKDMSEFFKSLAVHIKQGHKEIYEEKLLGELLLALQEIFKTNKNLICFEINFKTKEEREIHNFKQKALEREFCKAIDEGVRILYEVEKDEQFKLKAKLDIKRVLNKLKYKDWDKKAGNIEWFYLYPLWASYEKMRKDLMYLNSKGVDYYRIPLRNNEVFFRDIQELLDNELICEHLIGTQIKRDQINFLFEVLTIIKISPAKSKLLEKEDSIIKITIPQLVIFKSFQKMRAILDIKIQEAIKNGEDIEKISDFYILNNKNLIERKMMKINTMKEQGINVVVPQKKDFMVDEVELKNNYEKDSLQYGRFWIWENYIEEMFKEELLEGCEMLLNINPAVQQDIEDWLITEGMTPLVESLEDRIQYKDKLQESKMFLNNLKEQQSKNKSENEKRPPYLWNHPDIIEQKHQYRSIAAPKSCYRDQRIDNLFELIKSLADNLMNNKPKHWTELVDRCIDAFKLKHQAKPNPIFIQEYHQ